MAHMLFEWVQRRKVTFATSSTSEIVVVGDPVDVGDWKEFVVQVDTLASAGSYASDNAEFLVQTSVSLDEHARWEDCEPGIGIGATADDGATVLRITAESSIPLRKWARLVVKQATYVASQSVTIHAWALLKERTT